ncbi:MAG TPA: hypothetical protein VFI31_21550 [Pirellulales bacterium]|nr:hypothetical protein [Pirellulales bacterium]
MPHIAPLSHAVLAQQAAPPERPSFEAADVSSNDVFSTPAPQPLGRVIAQSLLGELRPELWRPLSLRDFFREGWNEQYAPAPSGEEQIAPRQTWINNADGAFYRLFVLSFGYQRQVSGNADAYNGNYFLFTPFSRRFEVGWFLPFVNSSPDLLAPNSNRTYTNVGDLTVAPRFLLAENRRYTVTSNLYVRLPTGNIQNGNGAASLSPDIEFWTNPFKGWVVRGGLGVTVPTNNTPSRQTILDMAPYTGFNASPSAFTSFDARLAIGNYITSQDARFIPNFVYYLSANLHAPFKPGNPTYVSLTPGFRFGIGKEWYLLAGVEVPVVRPKPFTTQPIFQAIKNF